MIPSSTFTACTSKFKDVTSIPLTFSSQIIVFWQVICTQSENNQCEYIQMVSKLQHGAGSGGSHPSQLDGLKQTIWPISICSTQGAKPKEAGSRWARSLPPPFLLKQANQELVDCPRVVCQQLSHLFIPPGSYQD